MKSRNEKIAEYRKYADQEKIKFYAIRDAAKERYEQEAAEPLARYKEARAAARKEFLKNIENKVKSLGLN